MFFMHPAPKKKTLESKKTAKAKPAQSTPECKRCGTCCTKGGPAFHYADKALIEDGVIHSKYLYTIRKGEWAYNNVRRCLEAVSSDIIKIKEKNNSWTCIFFDEAQSACAIYENRPSECRILKCWDTRELEGLYAKKRLTRQDLVSEIEGLWSLIKDHQQRCDYEIIQKLVNAINSDAGDVKARLKLVEIMKFDTEIRKLVVSTAGLEPEMLDFLFGRPLTRTIKRMGLKVYGSILK
jgi:Fe-S-cluster containining protein